MYESIEFFIHFAKIETLYDISQWSIDGSNSSVIFYFRLFGRLHSEVNERLLTSSDDDEDDKSGVSTAMIVDQTWIKRKQQHMHGRSPPGKKSRRTLKCESRIFSYFYFYYRPPTPPNPNPNPPPPMRGV